MKHFDYTEKEIGLPHCNKKAVLKYIPCTPGNLKGTQGHSIQKWKSK
jgi:hypothetical protein